MSKQKKILAPTLSPDSWRHFLADPEKHWRLGFSAMSTAYSWENSNGIPDEIIDVLQQNPDFNELELLLAIPEYKVDLPGGDRPSQNDVLALFSTKNALCVITVEGKAKEGFDKTLGQWKNLTSKKAVETRLGYILEKIGVEEINLDDLRYQLFHRLASAVIMAEKFHAKNAIMVIQSFNDNDKENHFSDFSAFLERYNFSSIEKSRLYKLTTVNGIEVFAAWVYSDWKKNMPTS
ncbi:MAG: hypothetical protein FD155_3237 [Bacteroidetes bacterium]|nr:MAG: hypothetical protein FD155_3237 [Bacteroidota bacterium]